MYVNSIIFMPLLFIILNLKLLYANYAAFGIIVEVYEFQL